MDIYLGDCVPKTTCRGDGHCAAEGGTYQYLGVVGVFRKHGNWGTCTLGDPPPLSLLHLCA